MKSDLIKFLESCGVNEHEADVVQMHLVEICQKTTRYHQLIGILNDMRLGHELELGLEPKYGGKDAESETGPD